MNSEHTLIDQNVDNLKSLDVVNIDQTHPNPREVLDWKNVNRLMKKHYIELTQALVDNTTLNKDNLDKDILDKDTLDKDTLDKDNLDEDYSSMENRISILFEDVLNQWNKEDVLDIFEYIFERCDPRRLGLDFGDEDYLEPLVSGWPSKSYPSKKLLKRIYDAVQIAHYKPILKEDQSQRKVLYFFWDQAVNYLNTPDYVWHFLECNILTEYDGIILEKLHKKQYMIDHKYYNFKTPRDVVLSRLKQDIASMGWVHNLLRLFYEYRMMFLIMQLYGILLSLRDLETHYARVMKEPILPDVKSWYENGIYRLFNIHLVSLQKRLDDFLIELKMFVKEFTDLIFEEYVSDEYVSNEYTITMFDDVIKETRNCETYCFIRFKEISDRLLRLSRKIHLKCYDVNFEWVKKEVMDDYKQSMFYHNNDLRDYSNGL